MKKLIATLGFIGCMALAGTAMATTWTDNVANNFSFNGTGKDHQTYHFQYDLTGTGSPLNVLSDVFVPGADVASTTGSSLLLNFSGDNSGDLATVKLDLGNETNQTSYQVADETIGLSATAITQLNTAGTLDLDIIWQAGTFSLTNSTLTVNGTEAATAAPVPEPGTVMLLGAGFFGLAIYGKRRKNA
jgi:hypothetical protein